MKKAINGWFDFAADWSPIETAPVTPWSPELPVYYHFRCLLQMPGGHVDAGEGYYARRANSKEPIPELKWRSRLGLCKPKYWMPLPEPKKD